MGNEDQLHHDDEDVKAALERETQDGAGDIPDSDGDYGQEESE